MLDINFSAWQMPVSGGLVLLLPEGGERSDSFKTVDQALSGALSRAVAFENFQFHTHKTCLLLAPGQGLKRVVLVGLGPASELNISILEEAAAAGLSHISSCKEAVIATDGLDATLLAHIALGARLRYYRFDRYRTTGGKEEEKQDVLAQLTIQGAAFERAVEEWDSLSALAQGVELTRDFVSEPGNILTPPVFAERLGNLKALGVEVEVLNETDMKELGFGALLGVAQGSEAGARVVIMRWSGGQEKDPPLAFIGKGVTFDSGGISIKPSAGMEDMKWDMAGAATVAGVMATLAGREAKVNAVGVVGLVENMPSGSAQRPGDVVTSHSGQTIEVLNTDAEGRLVLADILSYTRQRFSPAFMIDLATLTGAIIVSLGHERAGLFSNNDTLAEKLYAAGETVGEKLWRMPLGTAYDRLLRSDIADMKNIGGRGAGSITAAQFLQRFVNDTPWAHLDIAGTAWATKTSGITPKGATAFGVRLLNHFVRHFYEH